MSIDRTALLALFALPLVAFGCRNGAHTDAQAGEAPRSVGGGPKTTEQQPSLLPGATCPFPQRLDHDVKIAAGCVVDVTHNMLIESGSTLTIEPGVTLRFHEETYLEVGHKGSRLVAKGTADRPIVFTSAMDKQKPGDWVGVVFDDAIGKQGSVIEHAIVEYAGRESHGGEGAITVYGAFPAGRVSITDTVFRKNNLAALTNRHQGALFGAFEGNTFENNARAMRVSADVLAAIGTSNTFGDPVEVVGGTVDHPGSWPAVGSPILVTGPVYVMGEAEYEARLKLAEGTTLRFSPGTWIEVGTRKPGALDATKVKFTSSSPNPVPGDWVGILFGEHTQPSKIADCVIEYAGLEEHGGDGAITFTGSKAWQGLDVAIYGVQFHADKQSQISANGDGCNKGLDPKNGNSFGGGSEACR